MSWLNVFLKGNNSSPNHTGPIFYSLITPSISRINSFERTRPKDRDSRAVTTASTSRTFTDWTNRHKMLCVHSIKAKWRWESMKMANSFHLYFVTRRPSTWSTRRTQPKRNKWLSVTLYLACNRDCLSCPPFGWENTIASVTSCPWNTPTGTTRDSTKQRNWLF